jgi:hypothetical protein
VRYILNGKEPVRTNDSIAFSKMLASKERIVARTELDGCSISTVFLGLNHRRGGEGPPILFETFVFHGLCDGEMQRYCTWEEAEAGHQATVEKVKAAMANATPLDPT